MKEIVSYTCPTCEKPHDGMYSRVSLVGVDAPSFDTKVRMVCGFCASAIANLYSLAHSGAPISWPRTRSREERYRKNPVPQAIRWEVFKRDGFRCSCGSQSDLTVDHISPEILGGAATLENLKTLCRPCNSRKGVRA